MKSTVTTSLGIDIVGDEVNAVLLKKTRDGFRVLATSRASVPVGTIEGGRIVDVTGLLKALKVVRECRTRSGRTVLSVPLSGALVRVVDLEEEDPQAVTGYVRDEIAQYAAFSGRKTASDYHVMASARKSTPGRALVAAADQAGVEALVRACGNVGVGADAVEPAILACVRVFRAAKSRERLGPNVMLALLKEGLLTLAVLQKGAVDFIRSRTLAPSAPSPVDRYDQVADDVNAVLQFYTVEGTTITSVVVIDDEHDLAPVEAGETIRSKVACEAVEVWTRSTLSEHVAIEPGLSGKGSITALGLAMRFLADGPKAATVNLLPKEADRATVVQRNLVLTAIGLAALLFAVILGTGAMRWTVVGTQDRIAAMKRAELERGHQGLAEAVAELAATEKRIAVTTAEVECLTRASQSHPAVDWVQLLDDVGAAVPKQAQLTELTVDGTSILQVKGVCESNEDVATLVSMLNRSDSIAHAELLEAKRIQGKDGAIRYAITCTLAPREIR